MDLHLHHTLLVHERYKPSCKYTCNFDRLFVSTSLRKKGACLVSCFVSLVSYQYSFKLTDSHGW